jgi:hypothetical protein
VWSFSALHRLRSEQKHVEVTECEMHNLSNEAKLQCIEDYIERECAQVRKGVQEAETAML